MTGKPSWVHRFLARYAKDAPEEEVAEVLAEIMEEGTAAAEREDLPAPGDEMKTDGGDACGGAAGCRRNGEDGPEEPAVCPEEPACTEAAGLAAKLDRVAALLEKLTDSLAGTPQNGAGGQRAAEEAFDGTCGAAGKAQACGDGEGGPAAEPAELCSGPAAAVAALAEEIIAGDPAELFGESAELQENGEDPGCVIESRTEETVVRAEDADRQAVRAALMAVKPALAAMDEKTRRRVVREIADRMYGHTASDAAHGSYAALRRAADRRGADGRELGRSIMQKRNCCM